MDTKPVKQKMLYVLLQIYQCSFFNFRATLAETISSPHKALCQIQSMTFGDLFIRRSHLRLFIWIMSRMERYKILNINNSCTYTRILGSRPVKIFVLLDSQKFPSVCINVLPVWLEDNLITLVFSEVLADGQRKTNTVWNIDGSASVRNGITRNMDEKIQSITLPSMYIVKYCSDWTRQSRTTVK